MDSDSDNDNDNDNDNSNKMHGKFKEEIPQQQQYSTQNKENNTEKLKV